MDWTRPGLLVLEAACGAKLRLREALSVRDAKRAQLFLFREAAGAARCQRRGAPHGGQLRQAARRSLAGMRTAEPVGRKSPGPISGKVEDRSGRTDRYLHLNLNVEGLFSR